MGENGKWDKMKWTERFPFSVQWLKIRKENKVPLLLKIDISELEILHNKLLNNNNRLFLCKLVISFCCFENMCHHLNDCGQVEATNSYGMNSNSKWLAIINWKLFMNINCSLLFNDYHIRGMLSWWEALILRNITMVQNETQ